MKKDGESWDAYMSTLMFSERSRRMAHNAVEEIVHGNVMTPCQYCSYRSWCKESTNQKNRTCEKFSYDIFYE